MADDPKKLNKKQERAAWRLYGEVREKRQAGWSYQDINDYVNERSSGKFPGQASLENALKIPEAADDIGSGVVRSAVKGATLSFGDELGAGLAGLAALAPGGETPGGAAAAELARSRGLQEAFAEQHPRLALGAEIGGGVALPGLGGARAMAAGGKAVGTGARLAGAGLRGSGLGAAAGATEAAGRAEGGPVERLKAAVPGAAIGGAAGGLLGVGLAAAEDPLRKLAGTVLGASGPGRLARETLGELEQATGTRVGQGLAPGEMAAEVEPRLFGQALREAGDVSRKAEAITEARLGPVLKGRGEDLAVKFRQEMGIDRSFFESIEAANENVLKVREEFYRPLERNLDLQDAPNLVSAIVEDPVALRRLPAHVQDMVGRMGDEGIDFKAGQEIVEEIENAMAGGKLGSQSFTRMRAMKRRIVQEMEETFPGYKEANRQYYNAMQRLDAHEVGQKAWNRSPAEVQQIMDRLPTDEARDAYRLGALDKAEVALYELEGGAGTMASRMSRAGQGFKDRVEALFDGRAEEAQRFLSEMERQGRLRVLNAAVYGGPDTARRLTRRSVAREPLSRSGFLRSIVSAFWDDPKAQREAAAVLADVLTSQGEDAARKAAVIMARGGRGARELTGAAATVGGQQVQGLLDEQ